MKKKKNDSKDFLMNNILVTVEKTDLPVDSKLSSFGQNNKKKQKVFSNCDDLSNTIRRTRKQLKILTKMKKKLIKEGTCPVTLVPIIKK